MRNPVRMRKILVLLNQAWGLVPDWRLGQLISNCLGTGPQDVFYLENDELETLLKKFIADEKGKNTN